MISSIPKKLFHHQQNPKVTGDIDDLNRTINIVHPKWEIIDPKPNVQLLFKKYDTKFFQGKLIKNGVQLEWSSRMFTTAGLCCCRRQFGINYCTIRLSDPLLKLLPRKNTVETLLHEMIHAFIFIEDINDTGGHGRYFHKIMYHINNVAGTNITVYHEFHKEVNSYKKHVWHCMGACGIYIRRLTNRIPGPNEVWWHKHEMSCGGKIQKISEPEPKKSKYKKKDAGSKKVKAIDVDDDRQRKPLSVDDVIGMKEFVLCPVCQAKTNVNQLNEHLDECLGITSAIKSERPYQWDNNDNQESDELINDFNDNLHSADTSTPLPKKKADKLPKIADRSEDIISCPVCHGKTNINQLNEHLDECLEITFAIVKSDSPLDRFVAENNDDNNQCIEIIDDYYDYVFDDNKSVKDIDDSIMKSSNKEIISCPVCQQKMQLEHLNDHLDICLGITAAIKSEFELDCDDDFDVENDSDNRCIELIDDYNDYEFDDKLIKNIEPQSNDKEIISCPVCQEILQLYQLNDHLDECLGITEIITKKPSKTKSIDKIITAIKSGKEGYESNCNADVNNDESLEENENIEKFIELIDDYYYYEDDDPNDYIIGADKLMKTTDFIQRSNNKIISCPVCKVGMQLEHLNDHLDECLGITMAIKSEKPFLLDSDKDDSIESGTTSSLSNTTQLSINVKIKTEKLMNDTDDCVGQSNKDIMCPICQEITTFDQLNEHIDECLAIDHSCNDTNLTDNTAAAVKQENEFPLDCDNYSFSKENNVTEIIDDYYDYNFSDAAKSTLSDNQMKDVNCFEQYNKDTTSCPVCKVEMPFDQLDKHLDECLGTTVENHAKRFKSRNIN